MQAAIDRLVATTFTALEAALRTTRLDGEPILRTRAVERSIEALAGYAIGVLAASVAARLSVGVDLEGATAIRGALFRATSTAQLAAAPPAIDVDALLDDDRAITAAGVRARVADRLHRGRADAVRIVTAIASATTAEPAWLARVLGELAQGDLVATRFADQIERVWALLHGGTIYVAPPKPRSAPAADNHCWMEIR